MSKSKKVTEVRKAPPMHWVGDGFPVRSMFSYDEGAAVSPFLLLDYAAPSEFPPSDSARGVGEHPHRGFETVTIVYQGEVEHRDSAGNKGKIGPGDVQWMTAASGVVHEEMHGAEVTKMGGTFEMVQLWVNLPKKHKMSQPAYQDLLVAKIPVVKFDGGTLRVIAGDFQGAKGPARTFSPVNVWDLKLNGSLDLEMPAGHRGMALVLKGGATVNGAIVGPAEIAFLDVAGGKVAIETREESTLLVLSGEPIDEPVVGYGPFVMTSDEEIRQAIRDYQAGKMGNLATYNAEK